MNEMYIFDKPLVGFTIEVTCTDPHDGRNMQECFYGKVRPSQPEDAEHTFRMSTNLPQYFEFPERLIPLSHVVNIVYMADGLEVPVRREIMVEDRTFHILSSNKQAFYAVERKEGKWTCSCPGFHYRGNCRHITEAKSSL